MGQCAGALRWSVVALVVVAFAFGNCACGPSYRCPEALPRHRAVPENPMIHADGQQLRTGDGQPIRLIGANAGGWFHFESWMWGQRLALFDMGRHAESSIAGRLEELYGREVAEQFADKFYASYITADDFAAMAAMGFNSLRLPIHHRLLGTPSGWAHLDRAVDLAETHGVYLILDLHAAPGGQSRFFPADPADRLLWDDERALLRTVSLWGQIAGRYAQRRGIAAYDLLNEPDAPRDAQLVGLYRQLLAAIRAVDSQHLVLIEGNSLARDFQLFEERLDDNMAYEPHQYIWLSLDPHGQVDDFAELGRCHDVPIWVGEFGENTPANNRMLRQAYDRAGFAGWSFWPWKKVPNGGYPGLVEIEAPESFRRLVANLEARSGTPAVLDAQQALAAVDAFLRAARMGTARVNRQTAAALGVSAPPVAR